MKSEGNVDTVIKNWFLIDFTHNQEPMDKRVLWGIVVVDYKNRWIEGDYCCTSLVLQEYEGQVFHTKTAFTGPRAMGNGSFCLSKQLMPSGQAIPQMIGRS